MKNFVHILSMLAALAGGCKQQRENEASDAKIFGGEAVGPGDPVAIFTGALTTSDGAVLCTATLISPTVMVTAAHCLRSEAASGRLSIMFGLETKHGKSFPVKAYAVHPKYNPAYAGSDVKSQYDIGLVAMETPVPGHTPLPILEAGFPLEPYASTLKIAGYGFTDIGRKDSGVLRWAPTTFSLESKPTKEIFIDGFRVTNACSGDSGGPALVRYDGQTYLLGAASYVIAVNGRACNSGYSSYSDLRAYRTWINDMVMKLPTAEGKVETQTAQASQAAQAQAPSSSREATNSEAAQ